MFAPPEEVLYVTLQQAITTCNVALVLKTLGELRRTNALCFVNEPDAEFRLVPLETAIRPLPFSLPPARRETLCRDRRLIVQLLLLSDAEDFKGPRRSATDGTEKAMLEILAEWRASARGTSVSAPGRWKEAKALLELDRDEVAEEWLRENGYLDVKEGGVKREDEADRDDARARRQPSVTPVPRPPSPSSFLSPPPPSLQAHTDSRSRSTPLTFTPTLDSLMPTLSSRSSTYRPRSASLAPAPAPIANPNFALCITGIPTNDPNATVLLQRLLLPFANPPSSLKVNHIDDVGVALVKLDGDPQRVIDALHGTDPFHCGEKLVVDHFDPTTGAASAPTPTPSSSKPPTRPRPEWDLYRPSRPPSPPPPPPPSETVRVTNLDKAVNEQLLCAFLTSSSHRLAIIDVDFEVAAVDDDAAGGSKAAIVTFVDVKTAMQTMSSSGGRKLCGRVVGLEYVESRARP